MNEALLIDLLRPPFWICFAAALLFVNPIEHPRVRSWALVVVNLALPATFVGVWAIVAIVAAMLTLALVLRLVAKGRHALLFTLAGGGLLLVAFIFHKLPELSLKLGVEASDFFRSGSLVLRALGFSYLSLRAIEVSRAVVEGRHDPPSIDRLINYLLPFHMLAAGPIQAYDDFAEQEPVPSRLKFNDALGATERIVSGLFKKFVLAYLLDAIFLTGFNVGGWYFFVEVQLFFLWLYLDFSAYSDIAVGIGRLIGVDTPENFNRPYLARNLVDFWERWHISLSLFIRRNIFIPVQVMLVRRFGTAHSLFFGSVAFTLSFILCGLWHQISLVFFLWGSMHALGLVIASNYRYWLTRKLGAGGMNRYLENRWIRAAAVFVTYEYVAFSLVVIAFPWKMVLGS